MSNLSDELAQKLTLADSWKQWWEAIASQRGDQGKYYVSTAINYTNGDPHIGHAYEAVCADMIARYHRIFGRDTFFLTGTDEHGQKIAEKAASLNLQPIDICNQYAEAFQKLNQRLLISNDDFIRTTNPKHYELARLILAKSKEAGDIYLGSYNGWYNVKEEAFVTETEAKKTDYKDPTSGQDLIKMEEESYFFKMSKYQEQLVNHIKQHPEFIQPPTQRDFILKRLEEPLQDLSISRNTFNWGIPFIDDPKHVMYVWFDALSNYLTGIDWPNGERCKFWPADAHVIGKDIVWFHSVIWPCMLLSAGIALPKTIYAHGFVNDEFGKKMSKTVGNTVDPNAILNEFPVDSVRLYLIHDSPFGHDLPFSTTNLIYAHNADMADCLGNLLNRVTRMTQKECGGVVPDCKFEEILKLDELRSGCDKKMLEFNLSGTYADALTAMKDINGYLTVKEPWKIKNDTEGLKQQILRSALEAIYIAAHFLAPFIPTTIATVFNTLNTPPRPITCLQPVNLVPGTKIESNFVFKKIESAADAKKEAEKKPAAKPKGQKKQQNTFDPDQNPFTHLEFRVGQITKVWKHPKSDKLWCEEIDVGEGQPRQIASGLQQVYTEEQMMNARVIVLCNIPVAKLADFPSAGMVLCAKADGKVEFVDPPADAKIGERIFCEGLSGEPASAPQVKRRKIWQTVAEGLRTNGDKVATYQGLPLMTSAGSCTVPELTDAPIS